MKSKILLTLLFAGIVASTTAQTREKFYNERFRDNLFISLGGGIQACMNPDNWDYGLGDAITPAITFSFGKWITPVWGVRLQAAGAWNTLYSKHTTTFANTGQYNDIKNKAFGNLHADALFSLSNAISGYRYDRLFNVSAFAGPGLTFAKIYGDQEDLDVVVNGSVGLLGQFNVSDHFDINIEARGWVSPSMFGKYSNAHSDGSVSLTAGVTYTFGTKQFKKCSTITEADLLRARNVQPQIKEVEKIVEKEVVKEVVKEVPVAGPRAIFFQIGKSTIDDYGKVNIKLAADIIKKNSNKKYKIAGYADKATGSSKLNQKLSEARAQAVYDALIAEGVSSSQLEIVPNGGVDTMFGKNKLTRVVIME